MRLERRVIRPLLDEHQALRILTVNVNIVRNASRLRPGSMHMPEAEFHSLAHVPVLHQYAPDDDDHRFTPTPDEAPHRDAERERSAATVEERSDECDVGCNDGMDSPRSCRGIMVPG